MDRWDDLKFLLAIHTHGTMAAAARALGTNPATVSRRMERMADELGVTPVIKTASGWGPSPEMSGFIQAAESFAAEMLSEINRLRMMNGQESMEIRIACSPMISSHILFPNLAHHATELAKVNLCFSNRSMIDRLSGNDLIISVNQPTAGRLVCRKVGAVKTQIYAPKEDKETQKWVGLGNEVSEYISMKQAESFFKTPPHFRVETFQHALEIMNAARIAGILPSNAFRELEGFEAIPKTECHGALYMSYHESRKRDPAMIAVTDFIKDSFAKSDWAPDISDYSFDKSA